MPLNPFENSTTENLKSTFSKGRIFVPVFVTVFIVTGVIKVSTGNAMILPETISLFWVYSNVTLLMPGVIIPVFLVHALVSALISGLLSLLIKRLF